MKKLKLLIVPLFFIFNLLAQAETTEGLVVKIADGDTLRFLPVQMKK